MTHVSKFRFEVLKPEPRSNRKPSEVRVSYFDPRTGKPCNEKPKPLDKQSKGDDSYERNAKRTRDIEEAAEIMRNMAARKAAKRKHAEVVE